jgi:hypothetical protein
MCLRFMLKISYKSAVFMKQNMPMMGIFPNILQHAETKTSSCSNPLSVCKSKEIFVKTTHFVLLPDFCILLVLDHKILGVICISEGITAATNLHVFATSHFQLLLVFVEQDYSSCLLITN